MGSLGKAAVSGLRLESWASIWVASMGDEIVGLVVNLPDVMIVLWWRP
jgi:hypothetical protein